MNPALREAFRQAILGAVGGETAVLTIDHPGDVGRETTVTSGTEFTDNMLCWLTNAYEGVKAGG